MTAGEFVQFHSEYEQNHPRDLQHARWMADSRTARGLQPARSFPCPGALRSRERFGCIHLVECDVCGYEVGLRVDNDRDRQPSTVEAGF